MKWTPTLPAVRGWYFCQCRPKDAFARGTCMLYVYYNCTVSGQMVPNYAIPQEGALCAGCPLGQSWLKDALWSDAPVPVPGVPEGVLAVPLVETKLALAQGDLGIILEALQFLTGFPSMNKEQLVALIERLRGRT